VDFALRVYRRLLQALIDAGYAFQTFAEFVVSPQSRAVVLRHDVDLLPERSLVFACLQVEHRVRGSYYCRIIPASFNERIIRTIAGLGHEIGYHYEEVAVEGRKSKVEGREIIEQSRCHGGNREEERPNSLKVNDFGSLGQSQAREIEDVLARALVRFKGNLARMQQVAEIKTICMHGSPLSKWDSRMLWSRYDYRDFGLIGEPYFDINFNKVLYLTDTGRRWDGNRMSVRDKPLAHVEEFVVPVQTNPRLPSLSDQFTFHSTFDIIKAARMNTLPSQIMMTFHPQRWSSAPIPWIKEYLLQNIKNNVKWIIVKKQLKH